MKHLYIFLALLVCSFSSAQDPRLFESPWRLTKLITNGIDNFPPNNPELINIVLVFNSDASMLSTAACNMLVGETTFENNITNFTLTNAGATLGMCTLSENEPYDSLYISFFLTNGSAGDFTYEITESNLVKTLVITSMFGQQAIYSNQMMSTIESRAASLSIFPNPAADYIMVTSDGANLENSQIEIYNSLGKLCKTGQLNTDASFGIEDLSSGIYLAKVNIDGETITKKLVKL